MRTQKLALAPVLAVSLAGAARAQATLAVSSQASWRKSATIDPLLADDVTRGLHAELGFEPFGGGAVRWGFETAYERDEDRGRLFDGFATELRVQAATGGARGSWRLLDGLRVVAHAGAGMQRAAIRIHDDTTSIEDHDWAPTFYGLAGMEVYVPRSLMRRRGLFGPFTVGFAVEGGYAHVLAHALRADMSGEDDVNAARALDLGDLRLSAALLRAGIVVHF